jgi:hypothetical protein
MGDTSMVKKTLILWSFLLIVFSVSASTPLGCDGLIYVYSARTIPQGYLEFYSGARFYGKVSSLGKGAYTLWNVQGFSTFNYGLSKHIEIALSPVFYQDTNSKGGNVLDGKANFPDDLYLSLKAGSFGVLESPFLFGGQLSLRFPTASEHNIIYEPYSAGSIELQLLGLASYFSNTVFPEEGWSIHGNLGYLNHNDVGKSLTGNSNDPAPSSMSDELLFGLGFRYPAGTFNFSAEVNARAFLTQPPVTAYSREYQSYFTAGVYYMPYPWLSFKMGFDVNLISGDDQSVYQTTSLTPPQAGFPNYPGWRMILGAKIGILPTSLYASDEQALLKKKSLERETMMNQMLQDQKSTQNAESELSRIRAERAKLEAELERLRKLLESEKKKN